MDPTMDDDPLKPLKKNQDKLETFLDEDDEKAPFRRSNSVPDEGLAPKFPPKKSMVPPNKTNPKQRQQQQQPKKKTVKKKKKREKNQRFQDVEQTGKWGAISRMEMMIAGGVLLVVAIIIIVVVVLMTGGGSNNDGGGPIQTPPPRTRPPTLAPSAGPEIDPELQIAALLPNLTTNEFINATVTFPTDVNSYQNIKEPSALRAMSWILFDDPVDPPPESPWLLQRYALALLYYELGGVEWTNTTGWLTHAHACDWYGVNCDRFRDHVEELDLHQNNLVGTVPGAINLFQDMVSLFLSNNQLGGELPQRAIGSIPKLTRLFISNNQFTGSLSEDLRTNGVLRTFMAQRNNIQGSWPRNFCPRSGKPPIFSQFGIDCYKISSCPCCLGTNCF